VTGRDVHTLLDVAVAEWWLASEQRLRALARAREGGEREEPAS